MSIFHLNFPLSHMRYFVPRYTRNVGTEVVGSKLTNDWTSEREV